MLDCRGELPSLAQYTSWRIGGPAQQLIKPSSLESLAIFLSQLPMNHHVLWLGLGSNCLIRDGGFPGTVIVTQGGLQTLSQDEQGIIYAEAGVSCGKLARFAARQGLEDLAFLAGIPGTVGGSLKMNAGCHGNEIWNQVLKVLTINRQGQIQTRKPEDYHIAYRSVIDKNITHFHTKDDSASEPEEWFIGGYFYSKRGSKETSFQAIRTLLDRRQATQPISDYTCGSVFRNPPQHYAGQLIEQCGLKGYQIGGAYVSPKHANFIVNQGNAKASDVEELITHIARSVEATWNIVLEKEVKIYGSAL